MCNLHVFSLRKTLCTAKFGFSNKNIAVHLNHCRDLLDVLHHCNPKNEILDSIFYVYLNPYPASDIFPASS